MRGLIRAVAFATAIGMVAGVAGVAPASGRDEPSTGPLLSFAELAALGPVDDDVWVEGAAPDGSAIHRYEGTTGVHRGYALIPAVDGCEVGRLVPPTETGLWLLGRSRFGPPSTTAPAEAADFCLVFLPFDGGDPAVSRIRMKAKETVTIDDAFALPDALIFAGGLVPRQESFDPSKALDIRRLVPGGDPTVLVKGGQRVVPGSDAAFAIAATRSGWKVVRVDPATGRTRPVRVGGRTFFPFAVGAGDGLVAVSGQSGGDGRTYLIDAVSGAIRGTLATDGSASPAGDATILAGTLLTTNVGTGLPDTLWAAPVKRGMALEQVDRCDCFYLPLGPVPGGAWFARLPTTPDGGPSMVRWNGATGSLGEPVAIDPFAPFGRGPGEELVLEPLPEPPAGATFGSPVIVAGGDIPVRFTCDGQDVSPELVWSGAEDGVAEYAVVMTDPDAAGFIHWVVTGIPAGTTGLPEGAGGPAAGQGWIQAGNDFGGTGWSGPCPPARHAYVFTLYRAPVPVQIDDPVGPRSVHEAFRAAGGSAQSFSAFFGE